MRRSDVSLGIVSLSAFIVFAASPTPLASSRAVPRPTPQAPDRASSSPAPQVPSRVSTGVRETSWSPDGKHLAVTYYDAIWTMAPDGREAKALFPSAGGWISARDPAWSPDGKAIAFAAETDGEFDLWIVSATGGTPRRLTTTPGDERWPSWT